MSETCLPPKILLLVDGSSYLYRAFHAMPDLRAIPGDPSSAPTGAIRGMVNMLQKLRRDVPSDYAACVFDAHGPTFRDAIYPAYKAQRSPMPEDLRAQIEPIHELVRLMGWKVLSVPGVEADDVIGTLAVGAAQQGMQLVALGASYDFVSFLASSSVQTRCQGASDLDRKASEPFSILASFTMTMSGLHKNVTKRC